MTANVTTRRDLTPRRRGCPERDSLRSNRRRARRQGRAEGKLPDFGKFRRWTSRRRWSGFLRKVSFKRAKNKTGNGDHGNVVTGFLTTEVNERFERTTATFAGCRLIFLLLPEAGGAAAFPKKVSLLQRTMGHGQHIKQCQHRCHHRFPTVHAVYDKSNRRSVQLFSGFQLAVGRHVYPARHPSAGWLGI